MQLHWYAPSRGLCCEYCVLIAHCVGYCEKIPFFFCCCKRYIAQMTCNINNVVTCFPLFSTELKH